VTFSNKNATLDASQLKAYQTYTDVKVRASLYRGSLLTILVQSVYI
jgi:hypothetical protein